MFSVHLHFSFPEMNEPYFGAYNAAIKCMEYLSSHVIEDRAFIAATAPNSRVNRWLVAVDNGQVCIYIFLHLCILLTLYSLYTSFYRDMFPV